MWKVVLRYVPCQEEVFVALRTLTSSTPAHIIGNYIGLLIGRLCFQGQKQKWRWIKSFRSDLLSMTTSAGVAVSGLMSFALVCATGRRRYEEDTTRLPCILSARKWHLTIMCQNECPFPVVGLVLVATACRRCKDYINACPPSGQHFALKNRIPQNPVHLFSISLCLWPLPYYATIDLCNHRKGRQGRGWVLCPDDGLISAARQRVIGNCILGLQSLEGGRSLWVRV